MEIASRCLRISSFVVAALFLAVFTVAVSAEGEDHPQLSVRVSTGQRITPLAAPGTIVQRLHTDLRSDENADAANAVTSALSPDGKTLLILTSGFNNGFSKDDGTPLVYPILDPTIGLPTSQTTSNAEWVFVYDVSGSVPVQKQKINLPITYDGLIWDASGTRFYVSGGANDIVYPFKKVNRGFQLDAPFVQLNTGGQLDNTKAGPALQSFGLAPSPVVAMRTAGKPRPHSGVQTNVSATHAFGAFAA